MYNIQNVEISTSITFCLRIKFIVKFLVHKLVLFLLISNIIQIDRQNVLNFPIEGLNNNHSIGTIVLKSFFMQNILVDFIKKVNDQFIPELSRQNSLSKWTLNFRT